MAMVEPHLEGDGHWPPQACGESLVDGPRKCNGVHRGTIYGSLGMWSQHGYRWRIEGKEEYYSEFSLVGFFHV